MARQYGSLRAAAFMMAWATCAAPAAAQTPDSPKWEVEFHAGGARVTSPGGGSAAALPVGASFTTLASTQSRRQSSWFFGDGTSLLNFVNGRLAPGSPMTPLDPVILSAAGTRDSGATAGFRVARRLGSRYSAEFALDYARTPLKFTPEALDGIEASRSTFVTAFRGLFMSGPSQNPTVTAVNTLSEGKGYELLTTGVFGVDLMTRGRLIPFVVAGGGVARSGGSAPSAALVGNYGFAFFNTPIINETDRVTIRLDTRKNSPVGVFGGGVRYAASRRWGIRADVRFLAGNVKNDVLVDASPSVGTPTPGVILISPTNPSVVFSTSPLLTSTLTGPTVSRLRTFAGSGVSVRTNIGGGIYFRF